MRCAACGLFLTWIALAAACSPTDGRPEAELPVLDEVTWQLQAMGDADNPDAIPAGVTVTATFDPETSKVHGSGGCNRYQASYEVDGERISFGLGLGTKMYCAPPGVMETEDRFHSGLAAATRYSIDESGLTIELNDGGVMRFIPAGGQ